MKTYFVYDSETGFILSGFYSCDDKANDGYNVFTRPYKEPHDDENNKLDSLYVYARNSGLPKLQRNNLIVAVVDNPHDLSMVFVENPNYISTPADRKGWWKLKHCDYYY